MPEEKTFMTGPKESTPAPSPVRKPANGDESPFRKYGSHAVTVLIGLCIAGLATFYNDTRESIVEFQADKIVNEARLMELETKFRAQDEILLEKLQTIDGKVDTLARIIDEVHPRQ